MNETLNSSIWPNFKTSRQNWSDQFCSSSMNTWQNNISINNNNINNSLSSDLYQTPVDLNNLWSAKSEINDGDKDSYIKSIWSTNTSPNHSLTLSNIMTIPSEIQKTGTNNAGSTSVNSLSLSHTDLITSNERWGNIKINQTTPWTTCEIDDTEKRTHDPMVWRAKIDGTEVWEDYFTKQHGKRRPQQADNSFSENVWSSTSDISQSTNSLWTSKSTEISSTVPTDIFGTNFHLSHSNFNSTNGVKPSMTRNQAQKYLQEMGFSLSDSIGALVNNQMDLAKALNELQNKYRMTTNGQNISNSSLGNQSISFNNRSTDNINITRIAPCTPVNPIIGQNASMIPTAMMNSNFSNKEMFHSEFPDQMLDSTYMMNLDQNMMALNRMSETTRQQSMNMSRPDSFRNNFPNGGINSRSMSTNSAHLSNSDMNLLNLGMSRVNMNFNSSSNLINQNNSYNIRANNSNSSNVNNNNNNNNNSNNNINNSNGFNGGLHSNSNNPNLILNNNGNVDVRQNFSGMPNVFGRSLSKPPIFPLHSPGMNWHTDPSVMSPNGAMPDINQLHLAKNISGPIRTDKIIAVVVKKVQHKHVDFIKSMFLESGAVINFQLNPQAQTIIVQFTNIQEAYRFINNIQNQLPLRVELINNQDEYMHYMSGAN